MCELAGRDRLATPWAERGLKADPEWRGMLALSARQYDRAALLDEASELSWDDFRRDRGTGTWRRLQDAARQ